MRTRIAPLVVITLLSVSDSFASMQTCDLLAALEADPQAQSQPVGFEDITATAVIDACLSAQNTATTTQDKARMALQLGRGYLKAGRAQDALQSFQNAANWGYPAGHFALGVLFWLGDDVPSDLKAAHFHLTHAYQAGVIWAAQPLSGLHMQKQSSFYNKALATNYQAAFTKFIDSQSK